ncbi:hypothetical protein [Streptomyces montanisoli]|uniref:Uncharacterized protein n=1 Tax=Streptomyces montanisoli TaxID=2798581 RepID=A0A940MCS6_9ACTN|nr:hypothetical protein [Streptomyces montanisoli]MBP0456676.1 hypothetical protein [Streptomyces montanisoli]
MDDFENVSPEDPRLGLTPDLARRLRKWDAEYQGTYREDDPGSSGFPSPEVDEEFWRVGEGLVRRMAQELGPGWRVTYRDHRFKEGDREIPCMPEQ